LEKEIKDTNEYATLMVHNKVSEVELEMEDQFKSLTSDIKELQVEAKQNIKRLQELQSQLSGNIFKRILFGIFKIIADITTSISPAIGAVMEVGVEVGKGYFIKDIDASDINGNIIEVPDSVVKVQEILTQTENRKLKDAKQQADFRVSTAKCVLDLDNQDGQVLTTSTRHELQEVLESKQQLEIVEWANSKLKPLLDKCYKELDKRKDKHPKYLKVMKLVKVAQHASVIAAGVFEDAKNDYDKKDQIAEAIHQNEKEMDQLDQYQAALDDCIEPYMDQMQATFEKFANDTQGMAERLLIFKKFDLQKMTRQLTSLVRKFTDGFLREQQEMIGLVADLEAIVSAAMSAQTHVNQLEYSLQLSSLLGALTSTEDCSGSELCELRLQTQVAVHTNVLLSKFLPLERAFQQAIFPFASKLRLTPLVLGSDAQASANLLLQRVGSMVSELKERDEMINAEHDDDVRLAAFSSQYISSAPFYTWCQKEHRNQIYRFLKGEPVTFVADVRHADPKRNAVKFQSIGVNITAKDVDLLPILKYLELEMTHGGENHFRCGDRFYVIASDVRVKFQMTFELDIDGDPVSRNAIVDKYSHTDVPFSPFTAWTLQLKPGQSQQAAYKLKELLQYADQVDLELFGRGTFIIDEAKICQRDLSKDFDLFL
jgi:hypothetical protein